MTNATNEVSLPWMVPVDVFGGAKSNVNWGSYGASGALIFNGARVSSGAQNDEVAWDVQLGAGTWTFELMHEKFTDRGIYSVQLDTVEVGTIDGYTGGPNTLTSISGIVVTESGVHELKLKMATKNAASSAYYGVIQAILLRRTA